MILSVYSWSWNPSDMSRMNENHKLQLLDARVGCASILSSYFRMAVSSLANLTITSHDNQTEIATKEHTWPWGGGSSPSVITPLPHSNFELPWSGNFLIFMTFPPSLPPSIEKIFFPVLIPPLQKIFASLPYSPFIENFSSLSYSPLCKFFFAPCPIPPSLRIFSFPVLIPPLEP